MSDILEIVAIVMTILWGIGFAVPIIGQACIDDRDIRPHEIDTVGALILWILITIHPAHLLVKVCRRELPFALVSNRETKEERERNERNERIRQEIMRQQSPAFTEMMSRLDDLSKEIAQAHTRISTIQTERLHERPNYTITVDEPMQQRLRK